jgi:hypothetical protein
VSLETIKTVKTQRHPGNFQANVTWELLFERHSKTPQRHPKDTSKTPQRHTKTPQARQVVASNKGVVTKRGGHMEYASAHTPIHIIPYLIISSYLILSYLISYLISL